MPNGFAKVSASSPYGVASGFSPVDSGIFRENEPGGKAAGHESETAALELLKEHTVRCAVKSKTARPGAVELNAEVRLKDGNTDFVNDLANLKGVSSAVLVSYNGDYMG